MVVFSKLNQAKLPYSERQAPKKEASEAGLVDPDNSDQCEALANLEFQYPLRRYQQEILELINIKLERGDRRLHIVAPPGAGKTIIGLQIISQLRYPSLILCPNTTIQSQWGQKAELFLGPENQAFTVSDIIGTHEDKPLKPITLLTYQVLSTPGREQEYLDSLAHKSWVEELTGSRRLSVGEAELRILELLQNNPNAHRHELSRHLSRLRRRLTEVMDLKDVLHGNALGLIQTLRRQKFGLIIFDECHHLTDYWAAIMIHLIGRLEDPVVIGLTGTPPEGKSTTQEGRYLSLVGEIDYQVPTPALVKEGGLAPFQDLVYFTKPTNKEFHFLETQHKDFHDLIVELTQPLVTSGPNNEPQQTDSALTQWIKERIEQASIQQELIKEIPGQSHAATKSDKKDLKTKTDDKRMEGWQSFAHENEALATAIKRFLFMMKLPMPKTPESGVSCQSPLLEDWMYMLEDFASQKLRLSKDKEDHALYERIKSAARKLGYGITEQGLRRQASPVDRVLAFSNSKPHAVQDILDSEYRSLQDRLRAVIVTDFERMSATSVKVLRGVLDEESGGATAVLRVLLAHPISQYVNPCLVTGSLLLVDRRIVTQFVDAANQYILNEGFKFNVVVKDDLEQSFCRITASSSEWESKLYVAMSTQLFERGITKCLIGTRGLFGEGWDSQSLNTLIDLTTTTSPVSVKQLRGRSIRLQNSDPLGARKVANNWDVVCVAPELEKGLNDYHRFVKKHDGYFGICDDGQIECGVGHVHPSFSELTPVEVFASSEDFNKEMTDRALVRDKIYDLWKVGQPYHNRSLGCVEISGMRQLSLTPPYIRKNLKYKEHCRELRAALHGVWVEYTALGIAASVTLSALSSFKSPLTVAVLPLVAFLIVGHARFESLLKRMAKDLCGTVSQETSIKDIAVAVLSALQKIRVIPRSVTKENIKISVRSDGSHRVFLDGVEPEQSRYFTTSFKEVLAPITDQPYLIPKYEFAMPGAESSGSEARMLQFAKQYLSGKAQARMAGYHSVPGLLARSEKGRIAFEAAWNKYVSPGFVVASEDPELLNRYFGIGPSLAQRLLWE